jgi:hypothetical protein
MPYRRNPFANRKYFHTEEPAAVIEQSKIQSYPDQPARLESIPMPNEADENTDVTPEMRKSGRLSIIDFFKNRRKEWQRQRCSETGCLQTGRGPLWL